MSAQLRLFVAAYPPPEIARALLHDVEGLSLPDHRTTPISHIHLTIQFVGPTLTKELPRVTESVSRSAAGLGPFEVCAEKLISLPRRMPARLVAARLDQPAALMEIQRRLATRLARNARAKPGDRFLPHMTLCRFARGGGPAQVDQAIPPRRFEIAEIALMKSVLKPDGAEHGVVQRVSLA